MMFFLKKKRKMSDLLVLPLVELGQRWVVVAVTLGELRGFK